MRDYVIHCAQCLKVIRAHNVEIIFWKTGERPFGLHRGCEDAYEGKEEVSEILENS